MSDHTQGKLSVADINGNGCMGLISGERDSILTIDEDNFAYVFNAADARRLAACWNASVGVTTEKIEALASVGGIAVADKLLASAVAAIEEVTANLQDIEPDSSKVLRAERDLAVLERDRARHELTAASTLLSDALETFDDNPHEDNEVADRIRAFLKGGAA